jgi:hypothetical protein
MEKRTNIKVNNKVIGVVIGDKFTKKIKGSKHLLRIPPAISFDLKSLKDAYDAGAKSVAVLDTETGDSYFASMLDIYAQGRVIDRGYGRQIYLDLDKWEKVTEEQTLQEAFEI